MQSLWHQLHELWHLKDAFGLHVVPIAEVFLSPSLLLQVHFVLLLELLGSRSASFPKETRTWSHTYLMLAMGKNPGTLCTLK